MEMYDETKIHLKEEEHRWYILKRLILCWVIAMEFSMCCLGAVNTPDPWNSRPDSVGGIFMPPTSWIGSTTNLIKLFLRLHPSPFALSVSLPVLLGHEPQQLVQQHLQPPQGQLQRAVGGCWARKVILSIFITYSWQICDISTLALAQTVVLHSVICVLSLDPIIV